MKTLYSIKYILILAVFIPLIQGCSDKGFKQQLRIPYSNNQLQQTIDSLVIGKMNQYNIPGLSIGVVRDDAIVFTKGYGVKNIHSKEPVTEHSMFHAASISKLFTAISVMNLVDQKKIELEEKLVHYLPSLKYSDHRVAEITIKQLLNHTSGLDDIYDYEWGNTQQSETYLGDYIKNKKLTLDSDPGSEFQYNNLTFDILGHLIEQVTGTNFDSYIKNNHLLKSGMAHSDFRYFKIPDSLRTSPHSQRWITRRTYQRNTYPYNRAHAPSSTLNSSAKELSLWMQSILHKLNTSDSHHFLDKMMRPSDPSIPYIGLGFQLGKIKDYRTAGHFGGDRGFRSYLLMIPEKNMGLVLSANCDYNEDIRQEIVHPLAKWLVENSAKE